MIPQLNYAALAQAEHLARWSKRAEVVKRGAKFITTEE